MKTYNEMVEEIKNDMANGGKRTFSRELFGELSQAYLNDFGARTQVAKTKNGEIHLEEINVVDDFRKFIEKVLLDFGVDKQEATKIRDSYEFTNVDALYPVCSELIMNYIDTGKRFMFLPKEDCVASLLLDEFDEEIKENKNPRDPEAEPKKTLYKKHRKLKCQSSCPPWLKDVLD